MSALKFVRYISISQSSVVGSSIASTSSAVAVTSTAGKINQPEPNIQSNSSTSTTLENIEFQTLNKPSTVLTVNSPPSYPVYIKRGSLLSIYGPGENCLSSVRSQFVFLHPLWAMIYGGRTFQYQRLISTKSYSLLVSSIASSYWFQRALNKTFATLELDGTNDWAIFPRDALQIYSGSSLLISLHTLPSKISRKLSQITSTPRQTSTGLFRWMQSGFTLLSGRGKAGIIATGSIYLINLKEGEDILINRKNLVAVTTNGPHDLQNCIMKYTIQLDEQSNSQYKPSIQSPSAPSTSSSSSLSSSTTIITSASAYLNTLKYYWNKVSLIASRQKLTIYDQMIGNKDYIKVIGPRTLLLQTSNSEVKSYEPFPSQRITNSENLIAESKNEFLRSSSDYLNYVTITPKGLSLKVLQISWKQ